MCLAMWGVALTALTISAYAFSTLVPLLHWRNLTLTSTPLGGRFCGGPTASFSSQWSGNFRFTWQASSSASGTVTFWADPKSGAPALSYYSGSGTSGSGNVVIYAGWSNSFDFCAFALPNESVVIQGLLFWHAPLV